MAMAEFCIAITALSGHARVLAVPAMATGSTKVSDATHLEPPRVHWRLCCAPGFVEAGGWILMPRWTCSNYIGVSMPRAL